MTKKKGLIPNGLKIVELRKRIGGSQKGFADKAGVPLRTLQRAEKGDPIMPEAAAKIANALEVRVIDIAATDMEQPGHGPTDPHYQIVSLERTMSARQVIKHLRDTRRGMSAFDPKRTLGRSGTRA